MKNISHLRYFYDAARLGSIRQSAQINFVSPSAVSQSIKSLEEELDCKLLVHRRNNFQLTEEGEKLLERLPEFYDSLEELKSYVQSGSRHEGDVVFGTQASLAHAILPEFLLNMATRYPGLIPEFRLGTTDMVRSWLRQGDVRFAVTLDHGSYENATVIPIGSGKFVGIEKKSRCLDKKYIVTSPTPELIELEKTWFKQKKTPLPVKMRVDSWGVILRLVQVGMGRGFVPEYLLNSKTRQQLNVFNVLPGHQFNYDISVVCRGVMKPRDQLFVDLLVDWFKARER